MSCPISTNIREKKHHLRHHSQHRYPHRCNALSPLPPFASFVSPSMSGFSPIYLGLDLTKSPSLSQCYKYLYGKQATLRSNIIWQVSSLKWHELGFNHFLKDIWRILNLMHIYIRKIYSHSSVLFATPTLLTKWLYVYKMHFKYDDFNPKNWAKVGAIKKRLTEKYC